MNSKREPKTAGVIVVLVCVFCSAGFGQPWDGNGVEGDPYQIWTAADMQAIGADANYWDAHFELMADIDLSAYTGTSFNIIGDWGNPFTGVFDGNGHTISNFTYNSSGTSGIGVFGVVTGQNSEVRDVGLLTPNVDAGSGSTVGSLVGSLEHGTMSGCYVKGGGVSGERWVGGLVGWNTAGRISNCYSMCSVSGDREVGGLVGTNSGICVGVCIDSTISDCYSTASVAGTTNVGGLVGSNGLSVIDTGLGVTSNSYATGSVSGVESVGGLVGENYKSTVSNCYSTGSVVGDGNVGGLVGENYDSTVWASFWDKQTSGRSNMCGDQGGSASGCDDGNGKTTAEMQDINTFLSGGWDFAGEYTNGPSDHWAEPEAQGYMILWWQLDPLAPLPTFSGGAGTESEPYLISSGTDLNRIGHNPRLVDKHFKVINDIDLAGIDLWMIGDRAYRFTGVFDGDGHTVSNFTYDASGLSWADNSSIGLFRHVDGASAEIKDLGLIDPNVDAGAGDYVGSLVGYMGNGTISGCSVEDGSLAGQYGVGGLVGYNNSGTITHCHLTGSVSGSGGWNGWEGGVGGLVGNNNGTIANCHTTGNVSGTGNYIGGLVGYNRGTISDSDSAGSVSGVDDVGGLVGWAEETVDSCYSTASVFGNDYVGGLAGGTAGVVTNCYASGEVTAENHVGGLLGRSRGGTVTNCYAKGDVTGVEDVGGLVGYNYDTAAIISNCYSTGSVSGATDVGGLVGENYDGAIIDNCYAHGDAAGVQGVGGLVGKNSTYVDPYTGERYYGTITNCYSVGAVTAFVGDTDIGGLVGLNDGQVAGSLWDAETSGRSNMCGSQGTEGSGCDDGNGKTTAEMQTESTFTSAGWDFVGESANGTDDFWDICEGTNYPKLVWQVPVSGDFGCPDGVDWIDLCVFCEEWLLEELSGDVWPEGGDGFVNFLDWGIFADGWGDRYDIFDLAEFAGQWLKSGSNYLITDIAPGSDGDGITNGVDFAVLAGNWLEGM